MVVEGLSNIRGHTRSDRATVGLSRHDTQLVLQIRDFGGSVRLGAAEPGAAEPGATEPGMSQPPLFTPRSITERARALGGHARVEQDEQGATVTVEIPL
jgi:signal transduction histidine kinase